MGKVTGEGAINFKAGMDLTEVYKSRDELNKIFKDSKISPSGAFDTKPLTEYQAGLLKIKQEALELAKTKAAQAAADRSASLTVQSALKEEAAQRRAQLAEQKSIEKQASLEKQALLKEEARLRREQLAEEKAILKELAAEDKAYISNKAKLEKEAQAAKRASDKAELQAQRLRLAEEKSQRQEMLAFEKQVAAERIALDKAAKAQASVRPPTVISNSQSEIDAYNKSAQASTIYTSAINAQVVARARDTQQAAVQAVSEGTLRTEQMSATKATQDDTTAIRANNLTKEQAAKLLLEEKYLQAQRTKELKNSIREELNAKGSLEQRRAALIRLNTAYDRLSTSERATPAGQRLEGIVARTTEQVKGLEAATGRAQRNVGNYSNAFIKGLSGTWTWLSKIAQIIPGLGIGGIFLAGFSALGLLVDRLGIFKSSLEKLNPSQLALNSSRQESAGLIAKESAETTLLISKIKDTGRSMTERQSLLNDFISKNPAVLGALNLQNIATEKGTAVINDYIDALRRKIEMQSLEKGYAEALEKRADIDSGKEDTGLGWLGKSLITANKVLAGFKGESITEAIDKANARFKNQALIAQDSVIKGYEERIKATVTGEAKIKKVQDTSLAAAEARLSQVNDRLRTLQKGESDKTLKQQKAQLEKEIKQRTAALGLDTNTSAGKAEARAQESALKRQRTLQAEIDALTKKGIASKLDADQQEIVSVENKYKKLREKAIAFNNAKDSKGQKVNLNGLTSAETAEKLEITNKKAAKDLKVSLDEQSKYYVEFEDFKSKVGEDKAKERYAKLIDTDKTYLETLEAQAKKMESSGAANPFAMKLLGEEIAAEKIVQQKKYDDLVTQFMSYADKRKKLTEEFNATMLALENDPSAQAEKREAYERELGDLDDANAKKLSAFQALFNGVDRLSDENAKKVVSNAEVMLNSLLASGKISKELAAEIRTLLSNTTKEISDRMPERIINLANQIDRVADAVGEVDEGFGKMLHTVGNVVGQVGNIKKGLGDFKLAQGKGDVLGQLSAGLGIFGAGLSIVSGISKLFDRSAQREAQQAYATENQVKQNEALNKALERQVALINDAYGTDKLAKYAEAQATILKNEQIYTDQLSKRYSLTGNKEVDDILSQVNATGNTALLGFVKDPSIFDKYKIPVNDLKALQALLDAGKLDDSTAKLVQNLIDAKQAAVDLANQLSSETIGSSLDGIADSFIQNLTDGTQDFGKSFEDVIRTSILNGFKGKLIQQQLQGFYDQFAKATSDGVLSPAEIEALRTAYLAASEKAKKDFEDLEKATGVSLSDSTSSRDSTLTKNIKGITSDQASAIEGPLRGTYDLTKQVSANTSLLNPISKTLGDLYQIASGNLAYNAEIAANTANTVQRLDMAIVELKGINKNTVPTNIRGGGLG